MTFNAFKFVWIVFVFLTIETLFSVPLLSWELALGGRHPLGGVCFALTTVLGPMFLIWRWRNISKAFLESLFARFSSIPIRPWLAVCFVIGIILRVLWAWQYPAPQRSDQATYFALARGLVESHRYGFPNGGLAYWPPGYPFFLSLWFFVFGFKAWVPLLANLSLFAGTLVAVERLARRIGGAPAARLATLLLVPWPTMVMIVGFAGKELLVVFLLCLVLLTYCDAADGAVRGSSTPKVFLSGLLLGITILTQPSFQLFPFVFVAYEYFCKEGWARAGFRLLALTFAICAVILPWTLRNHRVLGAWIPISTNGGDVLYRANNPLATGGYTPRGEQSLEGLDEVARGRAGFRLGLEWIRANPQKFLALGVRKQILFLGDDAQGAFETLKRGLGIEGIRYIAWKGISNLYWWFLWMLILLTLTVHWRSSLSGDALLATLMLSVFYLFTVHSVFESGAKYHEPLMGLVVILAGQVVAPRDSLNLSLPV